MNKLYFVFLVSMFISFNSKAQACYGKHSAGMQLLTTQNGVEFYYQINHCTNGDEVLLKIINTNASAKSISAMEKVASANQIWKSQTPQTFQIGAQATLIYSQSCSQAGSSLEILSAELFPNEPKTQLMSFELFDIIIN